MWLPDKRCKILECHDRCRYQSCSNRLSIPLLCTLQRQKIQTVRASAFHPVIYPQRLTFLVVVRHVVCDHVAKVQEEVPCVFGNWPLVMLLKATQSRQILPVYHLNGTFYHFNSVQKVLLYHCGNVWENNPGITSNWQSFIYVSLEEKLCLKFEILWIFDENNEISS